MDPQKIAQLHKIIFDSKFPVESVSVHKIPFDFILSDKAPSIDLQEQLAFFDNVIKCRKVHQKFISSLPHAFYYEIFNKYQNFQMCRIAEFLDIMKDFAALPESKGLWRIYKNSDPKWIINIKNNTLNMFQKRWIMLNANQDVEDNTTMVSNIFEMLQPWLDKELYSKMKEETEFSSTRENVFYDDAAEDHRLRAKSKKLMEEKEKSAQDQKIVDDDDLDIITFGDE